TQAQLKSQHSLLFFGASQYAGRFARCVRQPRHVGTDRCRVYDRAARGLDRDAVDRMASWLSAATRRALVSLAGWPVYPPPAFGPSGNSELVNYRARQNYYVVDWLFAAAELRLGDKDSEKR